MIGANVLSFVEGFTPRERQDISDCIVLARLAATAKVTSPTASPDALSWLVEYFDALSNLGFVNVKSGTEPLQIRTHELSVVDIMLKARREVVGEQRDRTFLVSSRALRQLGKTPSSGPLAEIINVDSRRGEGACVQATVVSRNPSGTVELIAVAVTVETLEVGPNILSIRFRGAKARVDVHHRVFEVNMQALKATRDAVAKRLDPLRPQTDQYVRAIPDPVETEASE